MRTERRPTRQRRRIPRATAALALALLSCSTPAPVPPKSAEPMPPPPAPLESRSLSRPEERPRPPGVRLLEQGRYSLNVQNADLAGILVGLGRESSLNVVVEPGVTGSVTADLKAVSLLQVLEQIVLPRGFHYEMKGNVLRIFASDRETRTYRVDYPNYNRRGDTNVTIAGAVASNFNFDVNGASSTGDEPQDVSTANAETTQQVDFWDELERTLRGIVFSAGTVGPVAPNAAAADLVVSRQTGLVTVTGSGRVLEEVERFLEKVADATERQVLIDARVLEIRLRDDLDLGVDYEGAPSYKGSTTGVFERLIIPGYRAATIAQDLAPALATGGWAFGLASEDIGVVLRALALQRDLRVVSTPSITTMNNHKALIKVVRNEVYFIAEVESQVVAQVGVTQTTNFVPQIVPVGVTLDVTPQVSDENRITMHLHPSVSEVVEVTQQPKTDPDQETPGSLPVIDVRETDTVVTVGDSQTLVIGGLMQSRNAKRNKKLPLLGDIPYLGSLFREEKIEEEKTELVILLTPRVLDPPRIARIENERLDRWRRADDLRLERQEEKPWWRVPYGKEYGIEP